jgi:hypothetical protein
MNLNNTLKPQAKMDNLVVQDLSNEVLIYNLENNKAYSLNETTTLVWQNCDGTKDISAIAKTLEVKLKQNVPDELIWLALDSLKSENLVSFENATPSLLSGFNRREAIKRVGFATLAALPLLTSVMAPTAAHAQSGATAEICEACSKKGDPCAGICEDEPGYCFDNSGCGCGQQVVTGVTCAQCKNGVQFAGGVGTGSWKLTNNCPGAIPL